MYSEFLFEKLKNVHLSFIQLYLTRNYFMLPSEKNQVFRIFNKIRKYNKKFNKESFGGKLEVENVIFIEENLEQAIILMKSLIKFELRFWNLIEKDVLNLKEMDIILKMVNKLREKLDKIWFILIKYQNHKIELKYYLLWYVRNILNKKNRDLDEELRKMEQIKDNSSISSEEFIHKFWDERIVFEPDSCAIHISGNPKNLAEIINCSRGIYNVFGFKKHEIINTNVEKLMPKIFAQKHKTYISDFIISAKPSLLYKEKLLFGINKDKFIIPLWVSIKQLVDIKGNLNYVGLLKPLRSRTSNYDYIILNEIGIVQGLSENLANKMKICSNISDSQSLNILTLAPKLIQSFNIFNNYVFKEKNNKTKKTNIDHRKSFISNLTIGSKKKLNHFEFINNRRKSLFQYDDAKKTKIINPDSPLDIKLINNKDSFNISRSKRELIENKEKENTINEPSSKMPLNIYNSPMLKKKSPQFLPKLTLRKKEKEKEKEKAHLRMRNIINLKKIPNNNDNQDFFRIRKKQASFTKGEKDDRESSFNSDNLSENEFCLIKNKKKFMRNLKRKRENSSIIPSLISSKRSLKRKSSVSETESMLSGELSEYYSNGISFNIRIPENLLHFINKYTNLIQKKGKLVIIV